MGLGVGGEANSSRWACFVTALSEGIEPGQHTLLVNGLSCLLVTAPARLIFLALPQGLLLPVQIFRERGFDEPMGSPVNGSCQGLEPGFGHFIQFYTKGYRHSCGLGLR